MNPTTEPLPPPPQPPQPHRSSFSCDRHPEEQFTGFCPSCLCERLNTLDQSAAAAASSSSRRPSTSSSTAAAALKAIFKVPSSFTNNESSKPTTKTKPSFFPELRRTKSFSASKNEGFSGVFEPQRHSCDVRARNTLWTLFSLDEDNKTINVENQNAASGSVSGPVFESKEEEGEEDEISEVRVSEELPNLSTNTATNSTSEEIVNEAFYEKTMKDHIDLDSQPKKHSGMNFWSAASVFSKKWQKWMRKQTKLKKPNRSDGSGSAALPVEKPISRQFRETQSEIADYGFGRRSCDTGPRFSLDAGRISFDDPRYSFDEPRASWDGYLVGRTFPRLPPMVEDAPVVHVSRTDAHIPVVEDTLIANGFHNEDEKVPGGSAQTREYYLDSSSKRRKSLDRSSSIRKTAAAVVAEIDDMKVVSNAKVSPETIDYVNGGKVLNGDRVLRHSNSNSLREDCSETFELGFRDNASVIGNAGELKGSKKSRRWGWNIWALIHPRGGGNKDEEEERYSSRGNGVERSLSESWQELRREGDGEARGAFNRKVFRSNSSVSWRNSSNVGGPFVSTRKSGVEMNGHGKKKKDEFVLERNRSARYSPNNIENGLLRFYLTPLRGNRRGGLGKSKSSNSHSIARSVLRLY